MATAPSLPGTAATNDASSAQLLVLLAAMPDEQLQEVCAHLAEAFSPEDLLVAAPESLAPAISSSLRIVPSPASRPSWTLTATDFAHAHELAQVHGVKAVLLLGPESGSLEPATLAALADGVLASPNDLAVPCYDLPARAGLVNSAILYPLSRALFAMRPRFPLAVDLAFSTRMAGRLGNAAQRFVHLNQGEAPLWPMNEAAIAGMAVTEVAAGHRAIPQPADPDLNAILPLVAGSLFADVEAKAAFWQRPRQAPAQRISLPEAHSADALSDTASMVQGFRLAYINLQEIWSLVLPPNSLLGLKRLSEQEGADFKMPDHLWARIVYDFLLAWRLRTINRGHLLGAMVPLYRAWVASHFHVTAQNTTAEQHVEAIAVAFELEKPYLVSRWRWPDRFNP